MKLQHIWKATYALATALLLAQSAGALVSRDAQQQLADRVPADGMTCEELVDLYSTLTAGQFTPPACVPGEEMFDDVPASHPFCPWIEYLARGEITQGCGNDNYCPTGVVNRAQLATLLVKAREATVSWPGPVVFDPRTDVVETFLEIGGPGMSPGNTQIEHAELIDPELLSSVGRAVTRWQVVEDLGGGDAVIVLDCTIELADGKLVFSGATEFNQFPAGAEFSVTGGTGAYVGAEGTATVTPSEIGDFSGFVIAFELTP